MVAEIKSIPGTHSVTNIFATPVSFTYHPWGKGRGRVCPQIGPNGKGTQTREDYLFPDRSRQAEHFLSQTWSTEHFLEIFYSPQFVRLMYTLSPYYTNSISTVS